MPYKPKTKDGRDAYDPENKEQAIGIKIASLLPYGIYKPLEERMKAFMALIASKNEEDKGDI